MATERLQVILEMVTGQYQAQAAKAATATSALGTSAKTTTARAATMGGTLSKVGGAGGMLAIAGGALVAKQAFDGTVGAFASFDDAMNESLAIMGNVSDAMRKDMSDAAREVAKTTRFSADDAAESYFFLASAGLDAAASIEAMPAVAQFAQAGMFDMATATDLATDAQSALGLASDDASTNLENLTRVTDVFVAANTLANTSVEQIAEAMTTRAGAALRALDKDVEEGAAALAALADQGIKGAEAGTQLGIVLRDLQTKALENADAFEAAGISVFDAEGNMRNIADVLSDVEGRMDGMSDAQKRAELSALGFSDRSIAVLTTLLGTSDAIREYESELRNAGGTTEEVANNQLESAKAQWELFKSALADVGLELGENVLPLLEDTIPLLQQTADILGSLAELSGPAFRNPLPEDMASRAKAAADELGFWEQAIVMAGEAAARFTPEGRVLAGQLSDAEEAARSAAETNEFAADSFHNMGEAASMGAKGVEPAIPTFGALAGEMNQIPTGDKLGRFFRELGEDAGSSVPDIQDMAEAIRDVATARLEATDPAFAAIQAQQRADEALAEAGDVRDAVSQGEASYEDLQVAVANAAEAAQEADAANATLGANADRHLRPLQDAIDYVTEQLGIATIGANDLLDALGVINGSEVSFRIDATMDAADRALLSGIASGRLGGPSAPPSGTSPVGLARQHGGRVSQGVAYPWNEAGQELLIPDSGGYVVNHSDFRALLDAMTGTSGGGGGDFIVNIPDHGPHTNAQAIGALKAVQRRMESR
ncbi:MAG TPA: phage tail tape measure protein [Acidimicrobiia bacterium]